MARREYARIGVNMPEEASIKALDVEPQWLYDRLLLRPEISRCGIVPWRPAVLADLGRNSSDAKVRRWVRQIETGGQVVLDEPYAEVLVRTFVKHDKLLAQPNIVPHLVYDFGLIASAKVRLAFLREFRRLWDLDAERDDFSDSERGGWLLAVGRFPRQKHASDDPAKWPVALDKVTLARLVKEIGTGIREPLAAAIAAGDVQPFTEDSRHGIPEPFAPPHPTTPPDHPTPGGVSRGGTRTVSDTSTSTDTETSTGAEDDSDIRVRAPGPPAAAAANTHTSIAPADADQLIAQHGGRLTGQVRLALLEQTRQLLTEGVEPMTIAAGLALWRERPGSGPRLLSYLVCDLMLEAELPTKPRLHVNGSAPEYCGQCDPENRWEGVEVDGREVWRRCPRCHPSVQAVPA